LRQIQSTKETNQNVMSENNLDTPQEETGEQFEYEPSGWALLYNSCGGICIALGVGVLFIGGAEANELYGSKKNAAYISTLISFGILIGAALSSFLCGFLINTLTQIRDNTRYLLLETHKQNKS
jgi:hypothetical protein